MSEFEIIGEFITLSQFLKVKDYVVSGGETRSFLMDNQIILNGQKVTEKKKKIFKGDILVINQERYAFK